MGLFDIFSSSDGKEAAANANKARTTGLQQGFDQASGYLNKGLTGATEQYDKAGALFDTWYKSGSDAETARANALGLNGAEGNAAAVDAFQAGPGYEFAVNSGLDAIDRRAASRGMLGSGNTNADSITFSQGLANQEWQQYLTNLGAVSGSGQTAASNQASQLDQLASTINNTNSNIGNLAWQKETGVGNSQAQMYQDQYAAEQAASANMWSAIFGVGDLAAKFMGGGSSVPNWSGASSQNSSIAG